MKRIRSMPLVLMLVQFVMLLLFSGCTTDTWEWHASEYMVGDWEIITIETEDGELVWETDKWDDYGLFYDFITIEEDGKYLETITNGEDTEIRNGSWVSEEDKGVSRIQVTLEDGRQFEIAWTNSTDPCTIRYLGSEYVYVFKPIS